MRAKQPTPLQRKRRKVPIDPSDATVTAIWLRRRFGPFYEEVLSEHLEEQDAEGRRQFRITKALPTKADFENIQHQHFTKSCEEWIQDAFDTFDQLKSEYEEWLDRMPDSLRDSSKAEELQEVIDALDHVEMSDRPSDDWLDWIPVFHLPQTGPYSRPKHLSEAVSTLRDCGKELRRLAETGEYKAVKPPWLDDDDIEGRDQCALNPNDIARAADALDSVADEAEQISLPGMF